MEGLEKIDKWLHVWTEAERAARIKNQQRDRLGNAAGESPANRTEETGEVMRPACMSCVDTTNQHPDEGTRK